MPRIKGEIRKREVKIRLTETELAQLNARKTKNLAGWLRDLGLSAVPIQQADPELVRQVARIGSNLNQIAHHVNTYKTLDNHVLTSIDEANLLLRQIIELHKN